ncbi:MAG: hypothetical protein KatS3mg015_0745 [Fimbriimonadales bacterium]|nr:MAG: hypothetical protein KatS3mg015_0745 [Fimbriimonadales bacterium]
MDLSRREFLRVTGLAALSATLPLGLTKSARAASPPPRARYTSRVMGANIKLYAFDPSRTVRQRQVQQVVDWGFECLRDNDPFGGTPIYDMNHAKVVVEELGEAGVPYLLTAVDRIPGIEDFISPQAWMGIRERYPDIGDSRRCLTAIATGSGMSALNNFMLDKVGYLRQLMPAGTRLQVFNGPELLGYLKWNMFDPQFRAWVRSLGLPAPPPVDDPNVNRQVWENYRSFIGAVRGIWGNDVIGDSSHVYAYNGLNGPSVYYYPWPGGNKVLTEVGVSRYEVPDPPAWYARILFDVVDYYASRGLQWQGVDGYTYNVEEFFIHAAIDPRFLDLWEYGQTEALWDPVAYRQLIERNAGTDRQGFPEYDAVMMDPDLAAAVLGVMDTFRSNRGTYEPPVQGGGGGGQDSFGGALDSALSSGGSGQTFERGYPTGGGAPKSTPVKKGGDPTEVGKLGKG